jgi:adenine-specific DNA-methyltransferase
MSKATGSYYTPKKLSAFIWEHVVSTFQDHSHLRILEPSSGDGSFLQIVSETKSAFTILMDAIEIDPDALSQAKKSIAQENTNVKINLLQNDFLKVELAEKYDLVIGNPPYIGRKLLSQEQRDLCKNIHTTVGLDEKGVNNIWTAFVIKSSQFLNEHGALALVLPGELLQVSYAEEIRAYLEKQFSAIEILTFQELAFSALGQDVVVVFAYKKSSLSGVHYAQVHDIDSLSLPVNFLPRKINILANKAKWSNFVLSDEELDFLFETAKKAKKVSDYCSSTPGIVTGANDFFIVNKEILDQYELNPFSKSILQKASLLGNAVSFDVADLKNLQEAGRPCYFIDLQELERNSLPLKIQSYLDIGEKRKIHTGYKCSNREPWYNVPAVWIPQGVIFKRSHLYPKLVKNEGKVLFTDSAYRIVPEQGYNIDSIIYSFYNSLTLAFCELRGRFYGGGVLELVPSEFKGLPLPYKSINQQEFNNFKVQFKQSAKIDDILESSDLDLLSTLQISALDIQRLREIRKQLVARRLRNSKEDN